MPDHDGETASTRAPTLPDLAVRKWWPEALPRGYQSTGYQFGGQAAGHPDPSDALIAESRTKTRKI